MKVAGPVIPDAELMEEDEVAGKQLIAAISPTARPPDSLKGVPCLVIFDSKQGFCVISQLPALLASQVASLAQARNGCSLQFP